VLPESIRREVDRLAGRTVHVANDAPRSIAPLEALRALIDESGHTERRLVEALGASFLEELEAMRSRARNGHDQVPLSAVESSVRYGWIDQITHGCLEQPELPRTSRTDQIDRVLTHKVLGLMVFLGVNALVFQAIYAWSGPLMDGIEWAFAALGNLVSTSMPPGALRSLVVDGVIAGVGGVLIFLPQIAILFLFISVIEDCGYMARAALLMDRMLTFCGLSGKSFIPLLSSFACAVPGILATRTIEDRRDRITTILVAPLMSCSARLPIYIVFIAAFVPERPLLGPYLGLQAFTLLAMYTLGVLLAIPIALLLKKLLLRGAAPPFLMELPSYRTPSWHTVGMRVYLNSRAFVVRAGSVIMAATIVMWALAYFPRPAALLEQHAQQIESAQLATGSVAGEAALAELQRIQAAEMLEQSFLGRAGHLLEPAVRPLGWDWRIGMATVASFPAREVVISALGTIFSLGDQDSDSVQLREALRKARRSDGTPVFTLPVALSVMVFFALCAQCMSTLVTIQREAGSWGWAALSFLYMSALAYGGALIAYQGATFLGWGGP
jgi:ferrous iron transport protein B